jgi:hypothetical protein
MNDDNNQTATPPAPNGAPDWRRRIQQLREQQWSLAHPQFLISQFL